MLRALPVVVNRHGDGLDRHHFTVRRRYRISRMAGSSAFGELLPLEVPRRHCSASSGIHEAVCRASNNFLRPSDAEQSRAAAAFAKR